MGDVASIGAPVTEVVVTEVVVTEVVKPLVPKEMQLGKEVDVNTGKGIPGWVLRVEGRVLDVSWSRRSFPSWLIRSFRAGTLGWTNPSGNCRASSVLPSSNSTIENPLPSQREISSR